jgi:hypothetical protein
VSIPLGYITGDRETYELRRLENVLTTGGPQPESGGRLFEKRVEERGLTTQGGNWEVMGVD